MSAHGDSYVVPGEKRRGRDYNKCQLAVLSINIYFVPLILKDTVA